MKPFIEGEVVRESDGRLRFRFKKPPPPSLGNDAPETASSSSDAADLHYLTDEEAWEIFDAAARRYLKMSGKKFLRKWDAGDYPDPDAEEGVMAVVMLIPLVRPVVQDR